MRSVRARARSAPASTWAGRPRASAKRSPSGASSSPCAAACGAQLRRAEAPRGAPRARRKPARDRPARAVLPAGRVAVQRLRVPARDPHAGRPGAAPRRAISSSCAAARCGRGRAPPARRAAGRGPRGRSSRRAEVGRGAARAPRAAPGSRRPRARRRGRRRSSRARPRRPVLAAECAPRLPRPRGGAGRARSTSATSARCSRASATSASICVRSSVRSARSALSRASWTRPVASRSWQRSSSSTA